MRFNELKKPGIQWWISGLLLWAFCASSVFAQQINTIGGDGSFGFSGDDGSATSAQIADPLGVFVDQAGNVYIADTNNRRIRKIDTSGIMTTIAGNGSFGFSGDGGQATSASLADPTGVYVDQLGNVYVADTNNQRIRKINPSGVISTIAGDGIAGFSGDGGQATSARLNFPTGVFVDRVGNVYFADRENHRIRRIDTSGVITTVAGNGGFGSSGDGGAATSASLAFPSGVFVDGADNIYIADRFNYKIRKVDNSGVISTVAGNGVFGFSGDGGQATSASLAFPSGMFVDESGVLYVADRDNHRIRKVDTSGVITTAAGNGTPTYAGDGGGATSASLNRPSAVWADSLGTIWIADTNNRRIRKVTPPLRVSTQAVALSGISNVQPNDEVQILSIGLTGDGVDSLLQVAVTLSDLSGATGLTSNDFSALRLYRSSDASLSGDDVLLGSLGSVLVGGVSILTPSSVEVPQAETESFYLISAVMSSQAVDGHAFRVGFASGGVTTSGGAFGQAISALDANRVVVDIDATQLVFTVQPSGAVSGQALTGQPVVVAQNASGLVDRDFAETVTLTLGQGAGALSQASVVAVNGVATFTGLIYSASVDGETVEIRANDEDGVGTDLPQVAANTFTSDVVATVLTFDTQPLGSVSGKALTTQPVVSARDAQGVVDRDFVDVVTLTENSAGSLQNGVVQAVNGVATFTHVIYHAIVDGESFTLTADDEMGGSEGNLGAIAANPLASNIQATQLVFDTQPAGSVSGKPLTTQPVVIAQDDSGRVDTGFVETVTLSLSQGSGNLVNATVQAVNGVASFAQVTYTAIADGETLSLQANDADGVGSNLPFVVSNTLQSDVLATQLVFATQPDGAASGQALSTQPIVEARDSLNMVDTDFVDVVTLSEDGAGVLSNNSTQAVNGVATFVNVIYTATSDGEPFTISADDQVGGAEGDLGMVLANPLTSDISATQLAFNTLPGGAISGLPFQTQPIVVALDDSGRVDTNFTEWITLSATQGSGNLYNFSVQAVNGVATFTNLMYTASTDGEGVILSANDEDGVGADLQTVSTPVLTSNVLATQLIFSQQPVIAPSGLPFSTQPVVQAVNDSGQVDQDFVDLVTLSENGAGLLINNTVPAVNGVATFANLIYSSSSDGESFAIVANDVASGQEGDLPSVQSNVLVNDVVATRLVFDVEPNGSVSGQVLTTQPVLKAVNDSAQVDTDFSDVITLSSSVGSVTNNVVQAANGWVTFENLVFNATLDHQSFTVSANDETGGSGGDLPVVTSQSVISNVQATKLMYLVQPGGSVSGAALTTQPVVVAVDSADLIDVDFASVVTLTVDGTGTITNETRQAVSGIATFTGVAYQADGLSDSFRLRASADSLTQALSEPLSTLVIATQLVFATQPAGSVSGSPFLVQPIIEARDSLGQVDRLFSDELTLTVNGAGTLTKTTVLADSGRAVLTGLGYLALADQETFTITVDDATGGHEGDLPAVTSNTILSDVVATRLMLSVHPSGSVSGKALSTQPQIKAVDSLGVLDTGFAETILASENSNGSLSQVQVGMSNGIATFVGLTYTALADHEHFVLTFDDQVGGLDLQPVTADSVMCDVVATRLVFTTQPNGSISGKPLQVQPKVAAVDSLGLVDIDFVENIALTTNASGVLSNVSIALAQGIGQAHGLSFTATADHASVVLTANDAVGGTDLLAATSQAFDCDVVASALAFDIQPEGGQNGQALPRQPVVIAHDQGVVDVDFSDVVTLTTDGLGQLFASPVVALNGVAAFSNVIYQAAEDRELVKLIADDTSGGAEGNLLAVESAGLTVQVIGSRLAFRVLPSGILSGLAFLTQPVVVVVDSLGAVDMDFEGVVSLSTTANGELQNNTKQIVDGTASFSDVLYIATTGLETFSIEARVAGSQLAPAQTQLLTAGAGAAHHLGIFWEQSALVADGTSSKNIVVRILDENSNPRLDDGGTEISLLVQGAATGGGTATVASGEVSFPIVSKSKTGTVYVQVSADGLVGAVDSFQTVAGRADRLVLAYDQTPMLANGVATKDITIQLVDENGNIRTQDNTTLVALGVSGVAKGGGGTKSVRGGLATFTVQAGNEPGLIQLRANAGGLAEVVGGLFVGAVLPDLTVVEAPQGPTSISKGESHTVRLGVKNAGLDTVKTAFDVAVLLVGGADSIAFGRSVIPGPIAPDSTFQTAVPFSVPSFSFSALASDYHWVAILDAGGFVDEQDETNNLSRGNSVGFPELSVSATEVDFGTVIPDSTYQQLLLIDNRGRSELRFTVETSDSQLIVNQAAQAGIVLQPGRNFLLPVQFRPADVGVFEGRVLVSSNDLKGEVGIDVFARVASPGVLSLDFDLESGNQHVVLLEAGRDEMVGLELFVEDLPALQALSVDIEYNAQLLKYVPESWRMGGYFVGGGALSEETAIDSGIVRVSGGSIGNQGVDASKSFGFLQFETPSVLPTDETILEGGIEVVKIRFLREDGIRDSLLVQTRARVLFKNQAIWPDLDGNGVVGFSDFLVFMTAFKEDETSPGWHQEISEKPFPLTPFRRFDIDGDGKIGFFDFVTFAQDFKNAQANQ